MKTRLALTVPLVLLAALLVGCISSPALAGPIYSALAGFRNPPTSPWSYGYAVGSPTGAFVPFPSFTTSFAGVSGLSGWYIQDTAYGYLLPFVTKNMTVGDLTWNLVQPNTMLNLHPMVTTQGTTLVSEYAIVRFTAPASSLYAVDTFFQGLATAGTSTDVHILLLNNSKLEGDVNGLGPESRVSYKDSLCMAAGDTLIFAVGPRSDQSTGFYSDSTGFDATITTVPDPRSTLLLLGMSLARLGATRRRA